MKALIYYSYGDIDMLEVGEINEPRPNNNEVVVKVRAISLNPVDLKKMSGNPIAVGFGISAPEHVKRVKNWGADGVIIGSAFVKRIYENNEKSIVSEVANFCEMMREAADE
mgnify:CR=1 FL=1